MDFTKSSELVKKMSLAFTMIVSFVAVVGILGIILSVQSDAPGFLNPFFITVIVLVMVLGAIYLATRALRTLKDSLEPVNDKIYWYESMLDAIPFPISVTDMDMKWTFINRPVEQMLKVKRSEVLGKHCSSWGADICNTSNCGITCLRGNKQVTFFEQMGMDFQVDTNYLLDRNNKKMGHIEVVQDISKMVKTQKEQAVLIENIHEVSGAFVSAAKNIAEAAQTLTYGSTEQATAIDHLSTSLTNVADKTQENASMAGKASSLAEAIKTNAEKGSVQMGRMTQAVKEINDASQSINQVIKAIDEIASQTNLLALNAAIEAARAGQHGRGFAVVAEEVRNLAVKSAEAAKDTSSLIVNSMEKAEMGMNIANETTAAFAEIVSNIGQSSEFVREIDKSLAGQASTISEIRQRIGQVAQVAQQNNAIAEESAAISEEMSSRADTLDNLLKSRSG